MIALKVLLKGISRAFYYENAGIFIIVFLLAFGFLSGTEHKAIASAIATHTGLLTGAIIIWSIYTVKTILFFRGKIHQQEYRFLWSVMFLSNGKRTLCLTITQAALNFPILAYALLVLSFSVKALNVSCIVPIIIFIIASHCLPVLYYLSIFKRSHSTKGELVNFLSNRRPQFKKPQWSWAIISSLRNKPALWFVSKPVGFLILMIFSNIDSIEQYDARWIIIGILLAFSTNMPLLFEVREFRRSYSTIFNNLPIKIPKVVSADMLMITTIVLPEIFLTVKLFPAHHNISLLISLIAFGIVLNWATYLTLLTLDTDLEWFLRKYFFLFIILFLCTLFSLPVFVFITVGLLVLIYIYRLYYRLIIS